MRGDLSRYDDFITTLSNKYVKDSLSDSDDIQQELRLKLIEILPRLQTISEDDKRVYVYSVFRNHIRSIQRKSITRSPVNRKLEMKSENNQTAANEADVFTWEDAADRAFMTMKEYVPNNFVSQTESCAYAELVTHINDWVETVGGVTKTVVHEMLNPSDSTLQEWARMVEKFPTYRKFHFIPPKSLSKILGISYSTVMKKMEDLKYYLQAVGYSKKYLNELFNTTVYKENY